MGEILARFDPTKTQQAAAVLFTALDCRSMSRMKLLKLLYIADRESIRETGFPITGDEPVAMDFGPVLSATYNCIKEEGPIAEQWLCHFHSSNTKAVVLTHDPGRSMLSREDVDNLQEVARRFGGLSPAQLSKLTHEFPEWAKNVPPPGSMRPISPRDLLQAVGRGGDADRILGEASAYNAVHELLASLPR